MVSLVRPDGAPDGGRWLTQVEAARLLSVSDRTLRRRIAAGRLLSRRRAGRTLVYVDAAANQDGLPEDAADTRDSDPADQDGRPGRASALTEVSGASGSQEGALLALLREERERASQAEQAAAMWQERARNLETQVEQLLALPAHEEEPPRRWWRFWR